MDGGEVDGGEEDGGEEDGGRGGWGRGGQGRGGRHTVSLLNHYIYTVCFSNNLPSLQMSKCTVTIGRISS